MAGKIKAIQYGCGPIGCRVAQLARERPTIEVVGAVDIDPEKVGRDLGEFMDPPQDTGITITDDARKLLESTQPDVIFHTTGSSLQRVFGQLEECASAGADLVSTCEEISFPFFQQPEMATKVDSLAREHQISVLATGVNPGFLMDTWPLVMTGVCQKVETIKAVRIQDASSRRIPFQEKIGAGKAPQQFAQLVAEGSIQHVGLPESISMIAAGLDWDLERTTETIDPIVAEEPVSSEYLTIQPGMVAGVKQVGHGYVDGEKRITLDFRAYIGAEESYDGVEIEGIPDLKVKIPGGTHGDIATAAMTVNAAYRVFDAPPGLLTMKDLPVVTARQ